ncbi:Clp protease N-terminal domain-containing protein [Sphaerisporangium corydalis]|uniref:Clp protease N-terminal domain-containing protein n=1 Tax=Sphaerisporangium corydalis TaxID=1441875 RepID=A0ABV9EQ78_9ACTN|nr:Clp protease N-terminal domain-containing protein [Sphaerisporangium corydalis]
MLERFTARSPFATVVEAALEEARRRGDRRLGTEHLLLGLLHDPHSAPARAIGVDLAAGREALESLDRAALASIGIDVGALHPLAPVPPRRHPPLTLSALSSSARTALDRAVKATRVTTRHLGPEHLLLALLDCRPPDPVAELMSHLAIDPAAVRERVGQG